MYSATQIKIICPGHFPNTSSEIQSNSIQSNSTRWSYAKALPSTPATCSSSRYCEFKNPRFLTSVEWENADLAISIFTATQS